MYEEIEAFIEQNTDGILEGTRGVENLESLLSQIGYDGLDDFLVDCPGAIEAVLTWIGDQYQMTEWRDALLDSIAPDDDAGDPITEAGLTPWGLGRAAYHNGEDITTNPFEYGTEEHDEFETSFTHEREQCELDWSNAHGVPMSDYWKYEGQL